jgi:2-polyprenyl-6-hydroxyphenyl methylase/3-demethylubiquinone-9 3-methyltransferase
MKKNNNVDFKELEQFSKDSHEWWDEDGPFSPLHKLNPERIGFIRDQIVEAFKLDEDSLRPLSSLSIIDIGCGGGLVCEPLYRLGATITGLDADKQAISVAQNHATAQGFDINYCLGDSISYSKEDNGKFDVVLALEIIEHVPDIHVFLESLVQLCKPGGMIVISTLNRTAKSFALGIVAAEYILNWG